MGTPPTPGTGAGHSGRSGVDPRVAQTRRIVLDAAAELLAEDGFERLTIEAIAERSGVARSTIYRNWGDRSKLLVDAFERMWAFPESPDLGSLEAELRLLIGELARSLRSAEWARALPSLVGAAHHDPGLVEAQMRFAVQRRQRGGAIFERAIARGEITTSVEPERLAEYVAAPLFFRFLMTHQPLDEEFVDTHVAMILTLVGLRQP